MKNLSARPDPQFFDFSYSELLTKYREFGYSIATGGSRKGTPTDRAVLLELEREILRRESAGETDGGYACLMIGGNSVRVTIRPEAKISG